MAQSADGTSVVSIASGGQAVPKSGAGSTNAGAGAGRGIWWLLAALTLLALVSRLWRIDALLPHLHEPDGDMVTQAELIYYDVPNPAANHNWVSYPNAIARIASLFPLEASEPPTTLEEHLASAGRSHVVVRIVVACLSVLLIPCAFLLARLYFSARWSLFAAALVATSLLFLNGSQQARPHSAAAGITLLTVLASIRLRRDPSTGNYALAATLGALAFGILQFGAFAWPAMLTAHLLRDRSRPQRPWLGVLICAAAFAASILLFHGYLFTRGSGGSGELFQFQAGSIQTGEHTIVLDFGTEGLRVLSHGLWSYDPVLFFLTAIGLLLFPIAAFRARNCLPGGFWRDQLVLLAHALPFLLAIGCFNRAYPRFLVPLLPHCACFALLSLRGSTALVGRLGAARMRAGPAVAAGSIAAIALAFPTFLCVKNAVLRSRQDTPSQLAEWVRSDPARANANYLTTTSFDIPIPRRSMHGPQSMMSAVRDHSFPWWTYQKRNSDRLRDLARYDLEWFIVPLELPQVRDFIAARYARPAGFVVLETQKGGLQGLDTPLRQQLQWRAELSARFSPYGEGSTRMHKLTYDHSGLEGSDSFFEWNSTYAARVLSAERLGPILEVYWIQPGQPKQG